MHSAPPVVYPVGRCAFLAWLLMALASGTALVGITFLVGLGLHAHGVWGRLPWLAGIFGWLIWVTWAFLSWLRSPVGTLQWKPQPVLDGRIKGVWSWSDRAGSDPHLLNEVERALDLQGRILLRLSGSGAGQRWIWVEQGSSPARWNDLRRALVSSRA